MTEDWEPAFRQALREEFARLKRTNSRISQRAFAKRLSVSSGALSDLLNGKRGWKVSRSRAEELLGKLSSENPSKLKALALMGLPLKEAGQLIDRSAYKVITAWQYYAVLFSFDIAGVRARKRAQKAMGLTEEKFREIVADLVAKGFLVETPSGEICRKHQSISTSEGVSTDDVVTHHEDSLDLARQLLRTLPLDHRDYTSNTFAVSSKKLERIKAEIRLFHNRVVAIVDDGDDADAVYRLGIQLFPLRAHS